ncbi:hypothetical protein AB0J80_17980 [Actinoplanes sp. NPDC049548]|uniref:PulJ/GspJ family protein n=1 Tax=Actinoplanes sp. NPDC049548 TaxID=3155152 RepID=UPI003427200B
MTRHDRRDDGTSLMELLVVMGLMSVVMMMVTGAIIQVYRTVQTTDTLTAAQQQLSVAFQRFDRQLRYATWINQPGVPLNSKTWYVEFASREPNATTGVEEDRCRQLRLELQPAGSGVAKDKGLLQLIEWKPGSTPTPGARGATIAAGIDTTDLASTAAEVGVGGKSAPFELQKAGDRPYPTASVGSDFASGYQRLRIHLKTKVSAGTAEIDTTFTAVNTTMNSNTEANSCSAGRP